MIPFKGRLPESRRIKIGGYANETYQSRIGPRRKLEKWDHFKVTFTEREQNEKFPKDQQNFIIDEDLTKVVAHKSEKNKTKPKKIGPFFFPFDMIEANFYTTYAYYTSSKRVCIGDGVGAHRLTKSALAGLLRPGDPDADESIDCITAACPFYGEKLCRPAAVLSVLFRQINFGSVVVFRTKSRNSIESILTQLMIACGQRGSLVGIPFNLVLNQKRQADDQGKMHLIRYASVEFDGTYEEFLKLPPRQVPRQIDMGREVILRQKALMDQSAKILDEPEDFYDDAEPRDAETIEEERPDDKKECIACKGSGKSSKGEKCVPCNGTGALDEEKPTPPDADPPKTEKPEEPADPAGAGDAPTPPEDCTQEDVTPIDVGEYLEREWIITEVVEGSSQMDRPKAKYIIDAVNIVIVNKGRQFTDEALVKYGISIDTLNDINQENADNFVASVKKARLAGMSEEDKRKKKLEDEQAALINEVRERMKDLLDVIHPGEESEALLEVAAQQAVRNCIEIEIEWPKDLPAIKVTKLRSLSTKLAALTAKELKEKAEREKKAAEAKIANEKKQEEIAAAKAKDKEVEETEGEDEMKLF